MIAEQLFSRLATVVLSGGLLISSLGASTLDKHDGNEADQSVKPSTQVVHIPAGSDLSTIRFEKVKMKRAGDAPFEVTYSYEGVPLASDEHGDRHFTFQVYFRPEELSPEVRNALTTGKMSRADKAAYFKVSTREEPASDYISVRVDLAPPHSQSADSGRTR